MKTFKHKYLVESLKQFDLHPIVGVADCPHNKNCRHRYDNYEDICNGYQVVVEYSDDHKKLRECPCTETDARHIELKGWVK